MASNAAIAIEDGAVARDWGAGLDPAVAGERDSARERRQTGGRSQREAEGDGRSVVATEGVAVLRERLRGDGGDGGKECVGRGE